MSATDRPFVIDAAMLPEGDYASPGLEVICPDSCFPHRTVGDKLHHPWPYLRREIGHTWSVDDRYPLMGFLNRDEAVLLYNIARPFEGQKALEIGCWMGWSTVHLALAGVTLDVIDPGLSGPDQLASVEHALEACGRRGAVTLHPTASPQGVEQLAASGGGPWSLFFIDGDHEPFGPERDVEACLAHAAPDAAFVFHDLASPHVAQALRMLEARGFNILIYQTMQIMGLAWRGHVVPPLHVPDPAVFWQLPHHLVGFPVSGVELPGYAFALRTRLIEQSQALVDHARAAAERGTRIAELVEQLRGQDEVIAYLRRPPPTFLQRVKGKVARLLRGEF